MTHLVQQVQLLNTDRVDLVEHTDHWHVDSVPLHDVDQVFDSRVGFVDVDMGVVDPVLRQDCADRSLIQLRQGHRVGHQDLFPVNYSSEQARETGFTHTPVFLLLDGDPGWSLVQANAETFQFIRQDGKIDKWFQNVENDENEVARPCDSDDLSTSTLSIFGTFNDTWRDELCLGVGRSTYLVNRESGFVHHCASRYRAQS